MKYRWCLHGWCMHTDRGVCMSGYKKHLFKCFSSDVWGQEKHTKHGITLDFIPLWNLSHLSQTFKETCSIEVALCSPLGNLMMAEWTWLAYIILEMIVSVAVPASQVHCDCADSVFSKFLSEKDSTSKLSWVPTRGRTRPTNSIAAAAHHNYNVTRNKTDFWTTDLTQYNFIYITCLCFVSVNASL